MPGADHNGVERRVHGHTLRAVAGETRENRRRSIEVKEEDGTSN
jgi:hypothetical protein